MLRPTPPARSVLFGLVLFASPLVACSFVVGPGGTPGELGENGSSTDGGTPRPLPGTNLPGNGGGTIVEGPMPSTGEESPDGAIGGELPPPPVPDAGTLTEKPTAPTNLQVFTGGNNIALRWSSSVGLNPVSKYNVYRDNVLVGTVTPTFRPEFPEKDGNGFLDGNVTPGQQYGYRVEAVDVNNNVSDKSAVAVALHPSGTPWMPTFTVDAALDRSVEPFVNERIRPFLATWFPKVASLLVDTNTVAPPSITILVDPAEDGGTGSIEGNVLKVSPRFTRDAPQDMGVYLWLTMSMLQSYPVGEGPWITTGLRDWARDYVVRERNSLPPRLGSTYVDGFGRAGYFLNWVQTTYGPSTLPRQLHLAKKNNTYNDALFQTLTGKTLRQLWAEMTGADFPGPMTLSQITNKCVHDAWNGTAGTNQAQIFDCDGTTRQRWGVKRNSDNTVIIGSTHGGCLTVGADATSTANRTKIFTFTCTGNDRQRWQIQANGSLRNPWSGRCLDDPQYVTTNGTQLEIYDCLPTSPAQVFVLPK